MSLAESDERGPMPGVMDAVDPEEPRVTAYHEAGHAVTASVIEGGTVDLVTIVPDLESETLGRAGYTGRVFGWESDYAGPLAGAMSMWLDGDVWLQLEDDFLIDGMFGSMGDHCDVAKIIGRWARDAARLEEARRAVGDEAQLMPQPIRKVVEWELAIVTGELCDNWPAVEAVAAALLEHRTLDGDQVDELIAAAPKRHPWKRKNSRVRRAMVDAFRELVPPLIGQSIVSLRNRGATFAIPLSDKLATIPDWFVMDAEVKP